MYQIMVSIERNLNSRGKNLAICLDTFVQQMYYKTIHGYDYFPPSFGKANMNVV